MTDLMTITRPAATVTIDDLVYPMVACSTSHGVDQPVGTADLTVPLDDISKTVLNGKLNRPIQIRAGYDGVTAPIFSGRIVNTLLSYDNNGNVATIKADGWCSLLTYPEQTDLRWGGGFVAVKLSEIIRSILVMRGAPNYLVDDITYVDTDINFLPITLYVGGTPESNSGYVTIPAGTSPLSWMRQKLALWGYRIFDTPNGMIRVQRISGAPPLGSTIIGNFEEGVDLFAVSANQTNRDIINWWRVEGQPYIDADTGALYQAVSIPGTTPDNGDIDPPGYRVGKITEELLTSNSLAKSVRHAMEIDQGTRTLIKRGEVIGQMALAPGDVVLVDSPSTDFGFGTSSREWVMSIAQSIGSDGFNADISTWIGSGTTLPAGNDCVTQNIGAGPYHFGDQVLTNYAQPTPIGTSGKLDFSVANTYTTLNMFAEVHGSNWNRIRGGSDPKSLSRVEVWQGGVRKGTGNFPELQDFTSINYGTDDDAWKYIGIPLAGTLTAGAAELWFFCGEYEADVTAPYDDFEVRDVSIRTCGQGTPGGPV